MNSATRGGRHADLWAAAAIALALALGAWSAWVARSERRDLERVMRAEGEALAEALGHAVENAAASGREIEELAAARLLDLARLLERLDAIAPLDDRGAAGAASDLSLRRIAVMGRDLSPVASYPARSPHPAGWDEALRTLAAGSADEVVFPFSDAEEEVRFGAAVRRRDGGAILVVMDAAEMLAFAHETGPAHLIEAVAGTGGIEFAVLEDRDGRTIAAEASRPGPSPDAEPMEVVRSVVLAPRQEGVLRIGISRAALVTAERASVRRTTLVAVGAFFLVIAVGAALAAQRRVQFERAARERETRRTESLAALGRLAATVAHEVRNPLNAVAVGVQRLEREFPSSGDDAGQKRLTRLIREEVMRLDGIVGRFLKLARPPELHPRQGSLDEALRRVAPLLTDGASAAVKVTVHPSGADRAWFDEPAFRQIVLNLVRNAVEGVGEGGAVLVETRRDGAWAVLEVADDGPGIPPGDRERVFEFGFSTKGGTGLGLPTVQRLTAEMGGSVRLDFPSRGGTSVRVTFPAEPHLREER